MKTSKALGALTAFAAALAASGAYADAPRYNFVDLAYQTVNDPSGSGLSSDHAYGVNFSYALTDNIIGAASYGHEKADVNAFGSSGTTSSNSYSVGLGYCFPLTSSIDLVPNLSYVHASQSLDAPGLVLANSGSNSGYDASLLLRAMVTPAVELDANVDHSTPGSSSNSVGVAALYNFTHSFAVGLGYASSTANAQTANGWTVALRYYFK